MDMIIILRRRLSSLSSSRVLPRVAELRVEVAPRLLVLKLQVSVVDLQARCLLSVVAAKSPARVLVERSCLAARHSHPRASQHLRPFPHAQPPAHVDVGGKARACLPASPAVSETLLSPCLLETSS